MLRYQSNNFLRKRKRTFEKYATKTPLHCLWACELVQSCWKNNLALVSKAGDVHIPYSTEILCLYVTPRGTPEYKCQESFSQEHYL